MNKLGFKFDRDGFARKPVYCQDGFCFGEARHGFGLVDEHGTIVGIIWLCKYHGAQVPPREKDEEEETDS